MVHRDDLLETLPQERGEAAKLVNHGLVVPLDFFDEGSKSSVATISLDADNGEHDLHDRSPVNAPQGARDQNTTQFSDARDAAGSPSPYLSVALALGS